MQQITETGSRPKRRLLKAEREKLTELEDRVQVLAAQAGAEGCLKPHHALQLKRLRKVSGHVKKGERGGLKKLVHEFEQLRSHIKSALRAKGALEPAMRTTREAPRTKHAQRLDHVPTLDSDQGDERSAPPPLDSGEVAEDPDRLGELGIRNRVVNLMDTGKSAREALKEAKMPTTSAQIRAAQRWAARRRERGTTADGRWTAEHTRTVLIPEVTQIIMATWSGRRAATTKETYNLVVKAIVRHNAIHDASLPIPSYSSVYRYVAKCLPASMRIARNDGIEAWSKHGREIGSYPEAKRANQVWQMDNKDIPVWIPLPSKDGPPKPVQPVITVAIDVYSRAIMGYFLSARRSDSWSVALGLRNAVLPGGDATVALSGVPSVLVIDGGSDYTSDRSQLLFESIGTTVEQCPPSYGDAKANMERWFGTLVSRLSGLPGYTGAIGKSKEAGENQISTFLDYRRLRGKIEEFIRDYNHTIHSQTGEAPIERWKRSMGGKEPWVPEEMNLMLMRDEKERVIKNGGVNFKRPEGGGHYTAARLMDFHGERVFVRYNPEDLDSVLVYHAETYELLAEAELHRPIGEIKQARSTYRRGLIERTEDYYKAISVQDRIEGRLFETRSRALSEKEREEAEARQAAEEENAPEPASERAEEFRKRWEEEDALPFDESASSTDGCEAEVAS
jgi:hypothetical protein